MMRVLSLYLYLGLSAFVLSQKDPHFAPNRSTIVHLFEWKWRDIGDECERFLQQKGYGGVQISPPNENVIAPNRPWWERYQPVSYTIKTRSGDEEAFIDMTRRCNNAGIRIYADVVFNHMAGMSGTGTAGNTVNYEREEYPGVPYTSENFHHTCVINNYQDAGNVRNCQLGNLRDLNQGTDYVRNQIIGYLNHLIDLGVAGFRVDAAKHMWPADLQYICNHLKDLSTDHGFRRGARPFIYQEIIDGGNEAVHAQDYEPLGVVTEFKHCYKIDNVFQGNDKLTYLVNWGPGWGFIDPGSDAIVFVDNHDTQRDEGRLNYKNSKKYKMANAFMLAHPYGIKKVMSSYDFSSRDQGPPQDNNGNLISPAIFSDSTCGNGYICEHRWRQIANMVAFQNVVMGEEIKNWWSDGNQQIAFCRGNKGFIALTNAGNIRQNLQTCLPAGTYCDIISGDRLQNRCSGKTLTVNGSGFANIILDDNEYDGVLAIHIRSRL